MKNSFIEIDLSVSRTEKSTSLFDRDVDWKILWKDFKITSIFHFTIKSVMFFLIVDLSWIFSDYEYEQHYHGD